MKNYTKPTIDFIKLEVEERFAVGSGYACVETGACHYTDTLGIVHKFSYFIGMNG